MPNGFDNYVMGLMSAWTQHSALANKFIIKLLELDTAKALPVFAVLWLLWFSAKASEYRPAILHGFIGMFVAGLISRGIQDCLPERVRPLHLPNYTPPVGVKIDTLEHWSSFPSDHAAVFFALSTCLWLVSRRIGALAYAWSIFIVCFPRLFGGFHYASDMIGGAAIGILSALVVARPIEAKLAPWIWAAEKRSPGLFYACFFSSHFSSAQCLMMCVRPELRSKTSYRPPTP